MAPKLMQLWRPILAMLIVIASSNYLVQFPINDWLTWGAFTFPVAFLVTDLTNRAVGAKAARRVAWVGFSIAVVVSMGLALAHCRRIRHRFHHRATAGHRGVQPPAHDVMVESPVHRFAGGLGH